MKTVYCIAFDDWAVGGVDWYYDQHERDAAMTNYSQDSSATAFTMGVPDDASDDEITDLVDDAAWNKEYKPDAQ